MVQRKRHNKRHRKKMHAHKIDEFMRRSKSQYENFHATTFCTYTIEVFDQSHLSQGAEFEFLRDAEMPPIRGKRMKTQETCVVWDDEAGGIETKQIVKRYLSMAHKKLKASTVRPKGMEGTGSAVSLVYYNV